MRYSYRIVRSPEELHELVRELSAAPVYALDLETQSLRSGPRSIVGWAFSTKPGTGWYVPVAHDVGDQLDYDFVIDTLRPVLVEPPGTVVMHNAKFDTRFLIHDGVPVPDTAIVDSMLAVYVAAQGHARFGLKDLADKVWGVKMVPFEDLFTSGEKAKDRRIASVPFEMAGEYAAADADFTLRLFHHFHGLAKERRQIWMLESRLWPIVRELEDRGAKVDMGYLDAARDFLLHSANEVEKIVWEQFETATGQRWEFRLRSLPELRTALFDRLGLPVRATTPTGLPATDDVSLSWAREESPIVHNILEYRSLLTTAGQLGKTIPGSVREDGRVHTDYQQTGATTGRFSSSNPNLQNVAKSKSWPIHRPDGSAYTIQINPRGAFIAEPDHYLIEADFRQIEFVVMAALSGAASVCEAYANGADVHRQTYADVMGVPFDSVTKQQRDAAKTWNYLIVYGGSDSSLSARTGQSREDAAAAMARFFTARPEFKAFIERTRARANRTHRVSTYWGREQLIPEYSLPGRASLAKAERASVNRIVQGTAADIQKAGLIRANKLVPQTFPGARLILQTHDSQTWEVPRRYHPDEVVPVIQRAMAVPMGSEFPTLHVDCACGYSWGYLTTYEPGKEWDWAGMEESWRAVLDSISVKKEEPAPAELAAVVTPTYLAVRGTITPEAVAALKSLIAAFPGDYPVRWLTPDGGSVEARFRTSLQPEELQTTLRPVIPDVRVDRAEAAVPYEVAVDVIAAMRN